MPSLNQIIEEFRRGLELRDRALLHRISAAYHETAANILDELKPLQAEMEAVRSAGGEVTRAWLIRERRLSSLLSQVQSEMQGFAIEAIDFTTKEQWKQVEDAIAHTLKVISIQTPEGVGFAFNRLSNRAIQAIVGATSKGSPLRKLFDEFGDQASRGIRRELVQGVALGQVPAKTARRISDFLGGNTSRALTIARTETIRAYRESGRQTALENTDVLEGWTWVSALVGSCAACIALHGTKHPVEERMEAHPNCRCVQRWDTKSWEELGMKGVPETGPSPVEPGAAWFARQTEEMQIEVLGKAGFAAYKSGRVRLEDFVGESTSSEWGKMLYQRSLKAALRAAGSEGPSGAPAILIPGGEPIKPKLKIPPIKGKHLSRVVALIDSYHGDGPLHELPVKFDKAKHMGAFHRSPSPGNPAEKITISGKWASVSGQEFTFAHELGHYLDHTGMGAGWFASQTPNFSSAMNKFLEVVDKSQAIQLIKKAKSSGYRNYLLRPREIWARAYAQYIAVRTGDPGLLAGLAEWRELKHPLEQLAQWTDEDFEPIMQAIDDLLLELGWRKQKN